MSQMMNDLKPGNGDVEGLLRRFFRSEMPHPWPECEASAQARETPPPSRFRALARLALAASVVLFVFGYLAVAAFFPPPQNTPAEGSHNLGNAPDKTHQLKAAPLHQK